VVADALSRIEAIQETIDFEALATSQEEDKEMRQYKTGKLDLKLKKILIPGSAQQLYCDTVTQIGRPSPIFKHLKAT